MRSSYFLIYIFTILLFCCNNTYAQEKHLLKVKGGFRYLNENGEWLGPVIPTNLGIREHLKNGWFITYGEDYGLIDQQGRVILPPRYSYDMDIETGYLKGLNFIICEKVVDHSTHMGLVDTNGHQLLPFDYWHLEYYNGYWSYTKHDYESGVMDANFNVVIKDFNKDFQLYDHLIVASNWDSTWIYDYTGKKIYQEHFKKIIPYFEGRCFVFKQKGLYGLMNGKGEIIHPADLIMEPVFEVEGTALTKEVGKSGWNIIDTTGKLLIQPMKNGYFDYPNGYINFSNSNLAFKSFSNWGIADRMGNILVPFWFKDFALDSNAFQHDLYIFPTDSGWGMINSQAKVVLKPLFDSIWVDMDGRIFVEENDKYGMFEKTGKMVLPIENDKIHPFEYGYAKFQKNQKWGLLNTNGEIFLAPEYDWISYYCKYAAVVTINDQDVLVDSTGKKLTPYNEWITLDYYSCWNGYIIYTNRIFNFLNPYRGHPGVVDSNGTNISVTPYHFVMNIGNYFLVNETGDFGDGYNPYYEGGLMDKQGKLILVPQKKTLIETVFSNGSYVVSKQTGNFYYSAQGEKKKLE